MSRLRYDPLRTLLRPWTWTPEPPHVNMTPCAPAVLVWPAPVTTVYRATFPPDAQLDRGFWEAFRHPWNDHEYPSLPAPSRPSPTDS